jgi:dolichol-phosphate mannosyltransferase
MPQQRKVTVIVPAYNEEAIIENTATKVITYLEDNLPERYGWELVLVDDGSQDGTGGLIDDIATQNESVIGVHHPTNYGRGKAVKTGIEKASGDVIITLDADLSYSPDHVLKMLQKLEETDADIVCASCYAPGGKVENVPFKRAFLSKMGNKLFSIAFGGKTTVATCIVRAYRAEAIKSMDLVSDGKDLHPEILFKAITLGLKIVDIPATLRWSNQKLNKNPNAPKRKSKFKLKSTTITHLFILFWSRPFLTFLIPGMLMLFLGGIETALLTYRLIQIIAEGSHFAAAVRQVISDFTPSFILTGVLIVLGIQFFSLGFLAMLVQRSFGELYHLIHTTLRQGKK